MSGAAGVPSPFTEKIQECRSVMRKLRKKIYKYTTVHKPPIKKPKDSVQDILGLLKTRDLPSYVLEPIKKRRSFDIASLKNVVVSPGASLEEIVNRTNNQQNQIQRLFSQHKNRMSNAEKKLFTPKFDKKSTLDTLAGTQSQSYACKSIKYLYEDYKDLSNHYDSVNGEQYFSHYNNIMDPQISEFPALDHLDNCEGPNQIKFFQMNDQHAFQSQEQGHFLTL